MGPCTGVALFCSEGWNWSDEAFVSLFSLAFLPMQAARWKCEQTKDWVFAPVGIGDTTMRLHLAFGAVSVPVPRQHSTRYDKGMVGCVELEHGMEILGLPPTISALARATHVLHTLFSASSISRHIGTRDQSSILHTTAGMSNDFINHQLERLLNNTKQPLSSDLEGNIKCYICHEPFLSGKKPEMPIKLPCDHIFGSSCILRWLSPLSRKSRNNCPLCRKAVINDMHHGNADEMVELDAFSVIPNEVQRPRLRPDQLARTREMVRGPGAASPEEVTEDLEAMRFVEVMEINDERNQEQDRGQGQVQRVQNEQDRRLWLRFCEAIVRTVERSDYLHSGSRLPVARRVLEIDSLEKFLRLRAEGASIAGRVLRTFPKLHTELVVNRAISEIDDDVVLDEEQLWGPEADLEPRETYFVLHADGWRRRLREHGDRITEEYPLGLNAETQMGRLHQQREGIAGEIFPMVEWFRARPGVGIPDFDFATTRSGEIMLFQGNSDPWTEAGSSMRSRALEQLPSRMEAAIRAAGQLDFRKRQILASTIPEARVSLAHVPRATSTSDFDPAVRAAVLSALQVLAELDGGP